MKDKSIWSKLGVPDIDGDGDVDIIDVAIFDDIISDDDEDDDY